MRPQEAGQLLSVTQALDDRVHKASVPNVSQTAQTCLQKRDRNYSQWSGAGIAEVFTPNRDAWGCIRQWKTIPSSPVLWPFSYTSATLLFLEEMFLFQVYTIRFYIEFH